MSDNTERKLATIREVAEVTEIPGADRVEAVRIDGWWVVSQKGNFKVGDPCIYFEIDSFIPVGDEYPHFEFLRPKAIKWNGYEGARIKTIRLRGQVSQGLALPLNAIVGLGPTLQDDYDDGMFGPLDSQYDLTAYLGIRKWEKAVPASLGGKVEGSFPSFIPKTDQERVQNMGREFRRRVTQSGESLHTFEQTVKIDGSSMTVYLTQEGKFGVCSRNWDLVKDPGNAFWKYVIDNKIEELLRTYAVACDQLDGVPFTGIALQGELFGPGIQGNPERAEKVRWAIFDLYDIGNGQYYSPLSRRIVVERLGLEHARYLGNVVVDLSDTTSVDTLLKMADGPSQNQEVQREGIVFKSTTDTNFSFKAISNSWLLKNE